MWNLPAANGMRRIGPGGPPPTEHSGPTPRMVFLPGRPSAVKSTLGRLAILQPRAKRHDWLRPERPTGCAIVASWQLQENRMTPEAGPLGFGLFAEKNFAQIDALVGELTIGW